MLCYILLHTNVNKICAVIGRPVTSDSATPWTGARQAPLSVGVSRQEHCSGVPCPPPGDLPDPGAELRSPAPQASSSLSEPPYTPSFLNLPPTPRSASSSSERSPLGGTDASH